MTNTKRFMNVTGVVFTPLTGSPVTFTGVTGFSYDPGSSLVKFAGDGDRYNTTVVNDFNDPKVTITSADLAAINSLVGGSRGTIVLTHNDAKNRAVSGSFAITYTLTTAVVEDNGVGGQHRSIGMGSVTFGVESSDGLTNPVTFTVL